MKTKIFITILLLFFGCTRERTINGEIFIVTQGGENYKLGLVHVKLFDPDSMNSHLENKTIEATESLLPIYDRYNNLRSTADSLQNIIDILDGRGRTLNADEEFEQRLSLLKRQLMLSKKRLAILLELSPLEGQVVHVTNGSFFFSDLPPAFDSTKTDADGRFTFRVTDRDTVLIVAEATRRVGSNTEIYFWCVPQPNPHFRSEDKILLSNDNLFDPMSMIKLPLAGTRN